MPKVSIALQPDVFERFSDLNFKPSQAIAEFVDNAIQSYLDNKNNTLFYKKGYKLIVDVNIEFEDLGDGKSSAKSIVIKDNAAGIPAIRFSNAFETGYRPEHHEGLNEYGMGMKTAAFWLGRKWTTVSKHFGESVTRTLVQDLDEILKDKDQELDYEEITTPGDYSYTEVTIENIYQKQNLTKARVKVIRKELASIYRSFLRRDEIQINVNDEALVFEDLPLLKAPYYDGSSSKVIEWKCPVSAKIFGKEIQGYIGILNEMSENQSGLVIIRRGRVIVGESEDHLYHPACIFGSSKNSHQYKRLYGEIEIKGFDASFNKNGFSNVEELENMLDLQKSRLKVDGFSIIKQAEKLRKEKFEITWRFENGEKDLVVYQKENTKTRYPSTNPLKEGYKFSHWYPAPEPVVTKNAIYIAQWVSATPTIPIPEPESKFVVQWVFNNGQQDLIEHYNNGEAIKTPSSPIKIGYIFNGWTPSIPSIVTKDIIFYAQWISSKPDEPSSNEKLIANKEFLFDGKICTLRLYCDDTLTQMMKIDMSEFATKNVVNCQMNISLLPVKDKKISNNDVKSLLLSMAIALFKTEMSNDTSYNNYLRNIE